MFASMEMNGLRGRVAIQLATTTSLMVSSDLESVGRGKQSR